MNEKKNIRESQEDETREVVAYITLYDDSVVELSPTFRIDESDYLRVSAAAFFGGGVELAAVVSGGQVEQFEDSPLEA